MEGGGHLPYHATLSSQPPSATAGKKPLRRRLELFIGKPEVKGQERRSIPPGMSTFWHAYRKNGAEANL